MLQISRQLGSFETVEPLWKHSLQSGQTYLFISRTYLWREEKKQPWVKSISQLRTVLIGWPLVMISRNTLTRTIWPLKKKVSFKLLSFKLFKKYSPSCVYWTVVEASEEHVLLWCIIQITLCGFISNCILCYLCIWSGEILAAGQVGQLWWGACWGPLDHWDILAASSHCCRWQWLRDSLRQWPQQSTVGLSKGALNHPSEIAFDGCCLSFGVGWLSGQCPPPPPWLSAAARKPPSPQL